MSNHAPILNEASGFNSAFGSQRGKTHQPPLGEQRAETVTYAVQLLDQIRAGALAEAVKALATLTPEPEFDAGIHWPTRAVKERQEDRESERLWNPNVPSDDQAECDLDAADMVLRTLADQLATWALRTMEPVLRDFSDMIGLRCYDRTDHVIEIDGVLHLYVPANTRLAGNRNYTPNCTCGLLTTDPDYEGKLKAVKRGVWRQLTTDPDSFPGLTLCKDCRNNNGAIHGPDDCLWESYDGWTPLPPLRWQELTIGIGLRLYGAMRKNPQQSVESLQQLALTQARAVYLFWVPELMQADDKPCRWYLAPSLSDDDRWTVNSRTFDRRIRGSAVTSLFESLPLPTSEGKPQPLPADAHEHWRAALLDIVESEQQRP